MPSAQQAYPDFSSIADQRVAQHFKLVYDQLNALRDKPEVDLSGYVPITRKVSTIGQLLGGGSLDHDLTIRLPGSAATRTNSAIVTHSVDQPVSSGVITALAFNTDLRNLAGMHSTTSNNSRLTILEDGLYLFGGHTLWENAAAGRRQTLIYKNGDNTNRLATLEQAIVANATLQLAIGFDACLAGDYYEVGVVQTVGVQLSVLAGNGPSPRFWAVQVGK